MGRGRDKTSQNSPGNQTPTRLTNHKSRYEKYYIPGGNLYLVAKAQHFCIHSYFFEREAQAEFWKDIITALACSADVRKRTCGLHEDNPFEVDEDPEHVADFLWVFYNQDYGNYQTVSLDKWINILKVASNWGFPNVHYLAVSHINHMEMGIAEKIKLYRECDVAPEHLFRLYVQLASRERMLEREEFHVLDGDTLYAIVRARELLRAPISVDPGMEVVLSPIHPQFSEDAKWVVVAAAFGMTPEEIQALRESVIDDFGQPEGIN